MVYFKPQWSLLLTKYLQRAVAFQHSRVRPVAGGGASATTSAMDTDGPILLQSPTDTSSITPRSERGDGSSPVAEQKVSITLDEECETAAKNVALGSPNVVDAIANKFFAGAKTPERRLMRCIWAKQTYYTVHCIILFIVYWFAILNASLLRMPHRIGCRRTMVTANECGLHGEFCQYHMQQTVEPVRVECYGECEYKFAQNDEKDPAINVYGDTVYAANSAICPAAMHAGFLTDAGGSVIVRSLPGRRAYLDGGTRNGIRSGPLGHFAQSMRFERDDNKEGDPRRRAVRETYFFVMLASLLGFAVLFIPNTLLIKYESAHLDMPQTRDRTVCSAAEYVFFVSLNGIAYAHLVAKIHLPERNLVLFSSHAIVIGLITMALHEYYFRYVLVDATHRGLLCLFAFFFCVGLRHATMSSVLPQIGLKTGAADDAVFSPLKVTMLVLYIIAILAVLFCTVRGYFRVLGRRLGGWTVAKVVIVRAAIVAVFFGLQWILLTSYTVHVHHYFVGLLVTTSVNLPIKSHSIAAGLGFGLCVEGITRWGWEENFDPFDPKAETAFETPKLNATVVSEKVVNFVWSETNPKPWTKLYVNDMLWYDNITLPSWNLTDFTPQTTNYAYAISADMDRDFHAFVKSPRTEFITTIGQTSTI